MTRQYDISHWANIPDSTAAVQPRRSADVAETYITIVFTMPGTSTSWHEGSERRFRARKIRSTKQNCSTFNKKYWRVYIYLCIWLSAATSTIHVNNGLFGNPMDPTREYVNWSKRKEMQPSEVHDNKFTHKSFPWITSGNISSMKYRDSLYRKLKRRDALSAEHSELWPLLLTWFNFNPSMDK